MASPLSVKTSVRTAAAWVPSLSKRIPSATLAALQDPQSPMAVITTSQREARSRAMSSGTGLPK